jgi:hypothetical protein
LCARLWQPEPEAIFPRKFRAKQSQKISPTSATATIGGIWG